MKRMDWLKKEFERAYISQWQDYEIIWKEGKPYAHCKTISIDDTCVEKIFNIFCAGPYEKKSELSKEEMKK
jgi:hypothetical protein